MRPTSPDASSAIEAAIQSATFQTALDCIVVMDRAGRILEFNPAAERTFGYTRAEAIGKDLGELIVPPSLRETHRRGLERYLAEGRTAFVGRRVETMAMRKAVGSRTGRLTIEQLAGNGTVIVGSPQTVRNRIEAVREATGVNRLVTMLQFGVLPNDLALRNMEMFASEVMPKLKN